MPSTIAIDGPAGSGKSTVAKQLARRLGYLYFDTGVMYRAVTLAALRRAVPLSDGEGLARLAEGLRIDVLPPTVEDGRQYTVLLNGEDVTWAIRDAAVDRNVSAVSAVPGVRAAMLDPQRDVGRRGRVIMVGRDIGTIVLPEADLKIFLDATLDERAHRRCAELQLRGQPVSYEQVHTSLRERDRIDSTRAAAPLRAAPDAVLLDSTGMDISSVVGHLENLIRADC